MLPSAKIVKKTAFTALKENYLGALAASVLTVFASSVALVLPSLLFSVMNEFLAIIIMLGVFLFLLSPLFLGGLKFMRRLLWGEKDSAVLIFSYFSNSADYIRALKFSVLFFARGFLAWVVLMLPAVTANLLSQSSFYARFGSTMPSWAPSLWILAAILKVVAAVGVLFVFSRYYVAPFVFVSNEDLEPEKIISLSAIVCRRSGSDLLWLTLSLILWILLSFLVVPLPFTLPVISACYCVFCRFSLAHYNKQAASLKTDSTAPSFDADY